MPDGTRKRGLLVAIVGPSGAGKDTVTRHALEGLGEDAARLHLARRVVTRIAAKASEDHDSLDEAAFARAEAKGAFCLTWRANGLAYGLPVGVQAKLADGAIVLANLSRRSLAEAASRFGRIAIVEIVAPRDVLLARITARGREPPSQIEARLGRQMATEAPPGAVALLRIDNSGTIDDAALQLRRFITDLLGALAEDAMPIGEDTPPWTSMRSCPSNEDSAAG